MDTDENLISIIKSAQSGDSNRFGQVYELYVDRIYRFVYVRTSHKQTAEDLTSEIFFKTWKNISSFKLESGNFTAWIYTIARNQITDHYRTNKITEDIQMHEDLQDKTSLNEEIHNRMLLEKVKEALLELSEKDREIIQLRVWDGLSHREIAEMLGSSESAVKVAFLRAMRRLQTVNPTAIVLLLSLVIYD